MFKWCEKTFLLTARLSWLQIFTIAENLFHLQWILMVTISNAFLFPLQVSILMALQSLHWNSDQIGRKDCQPESVADQPSIYLLLSFPYPGCLFVALLPEKWYHFISIRRPSLQASHRHWHRVRGIVLFRIFLCQKCSPFLQQFLSPLHYLGTSNTLICRFCSSTLYHHIALFSLSWNGSNTVLLMGKMVLLKIFLLAQIYQQSKSLFYH